MLAWHYTTQQKLPMIVASGVLLPASAGVLPPEKPILWFSTNPYWENTANKGIQDPTNPTGIRILTMEETYRLCSGLIRFGCDTKHLLFGESLRKRAKMEKLLWIALCQVAKQKGANPDEWRGIVKPLPIKDLVFEVMNHQFQWERSSL